MEETLSLPTSNNNTNNLILKIPTKEGAYYLHDINQQDNTITITKTLGTIIKYPKTKFKFEIDDKGLVHFDGEGFISTLHLNYFLELAKQI